MTSSFQSAILPPEVKGYRIYQRVHDQEEVVPSQTMLRVVVRNQNNGIPRIRHDVICNGKHYPFVPLFTFTSEDDLRIIEQVSAIVLRDENQSLCEILTNKVSEVKSSQFLDLRQRMKTVFGLQLKIDPQQLFLILISDQITTQAEFNRIFDSVSETEFVNVIKRIYENCPNRTIPKILRKFTKYFNSTKARAKSSTQRLKTFLKIAKNAQQNVQAQQSQEPVASSVQEQQSQQSLDQQQTQIKPQTSSKKLVSANNVKVPPKVQQKPKKQSMAKQQVQKPKKQPLTKQVVQKPKKQPSTKQQVQNPAKQAFVVNLTQKVPQTQTVTKTQRVRKTQKVKNSQKPSQHPSQQVKQSLQIQQQEWHDAQQQSDDSDSDDIQDRINNMAFVQDQDQDDQLTYQGPKKKKKKQNNNARIPFDAQFDRNLGKKQQRPKKHKNNRNPTANANNSRKQSTEDYQKPQQADNFDRRNNRQANTRNGSNNNQQSQQRGRRQFSKQNKKIDSRILLGLNGGSDAVWRQKMRPPRYPREQTSNFSQDRGQSSRQNGQSRPNRQFKQSRQFRQNRSSKAQISATQSLIVTKITQSKTQGTRKKQLSEAKNLSLQRIFCIPDDTQKGKKLKFENRNYNLFVNKLFWVNISEGQVTIQKEGKGYIRKCPIEVIDNGNGIMADGLTLDIDGLSNLQDGGTAFGDPVFQQFTPEGQWFHISTLEVYGYI